MDWQDRTNQPMGYVDGPAKIHVVENGPVRVALEVQRSARGSDFVQTIRLATGGDRVEMANRIDWQTTNASLKAAFPLLLFVFYRKAFTGIIDGVVYCGLSATGFAMVENILYLGGHGYGVVSVDASRMVTDFVCIPRPIQRAATPDGGPLRYRVRHEVPLWRAEEAPQMRLTVLEGDAGLAA